jgi:ElaB/YqjD/DUF883 family membrane-anchored ribosome-binding protein
MPANAVDTPTEPNGSASTGATPVADTATRLSAEAQRSFAEAARKIEQAVSEGLEQIRAQSRTYADTAGQRVDEAQKYLSERVREKPLVSAGTALGIGVVLGLLLSGRRR